MPISASATRVFNPKLESKIMSAEEAAGLIQSGRSDWHERIYRLGISQGGAD